MDNINGKWRIALFPEFDENDGLIFLTREEMLKRKPKDKDLKFLMDTIIVIDNNKLSMQMELKGKEKEEAINEGLTNLGGDLFECESIDLVEKDGKMCFEMGYDEANDCPHYDPLVLEDGYLIYMIYKLERI